MIELHLRQSLFLERACGPFNKHRQRIKKIKEIGDLNYVYKDELDKACFAHYSGYAYSKDLVKRTGSDMILKDRLLKQH